MLEDPIIGLRFQNGVLIATKSSLTRDSFIISKSTEKIKSFGNVLVCGTGNAADIDIINEKVLSLMRRYQLECGLNPSTKTVARLLVNECRNRENCDFTIAGVTGNHLELYQVVDGALIESTSYTIQGGRDLCAAAIGVLDLEYNSGMSLEAAKELCTKSLNLGMFGSKGEVIISHLLL